MSSPSPAAPSPLAAPPTAPQVDVMDDTWIDAPPSVVGAYLAVAANWPAWWPDLTLAVTEQRGPKGVRWRVPTALGGRASGTMEVWLQPVDGGTVAHFFLRLWGLGRPLTQKESRRAADAQRRAAKRAMWALADTIDPGRLCRVGGPQSG